MVIVIIGPSGSGKDTQSKFIVEKYNIPNISTGRIMREVIAEGGELGKEIDSYISLGNWLPDDLTYRLLIERLEKEDCSRGFILNGFPRTQGQIPLFDEILNDKNENLVAVVHFNLPDEEVIRRMKSQISESEERSDREYSAILTRLESYKNTINPILEEFGKRGVLVDVDATPSIEEIREVVAREIDKRLSN